MGRLTVPHFDDKGHYMKCSEQFGCSGECADCEELDKIVEKLAEYEDKEERKPQTNADRIRAMSDEELAEYIDAVAEACYNAGSEDLPLSNSNPLSNAYNILEWLKQPVEDTP